MKKQLTLLGFVVAALCLMTACSSGGSHAPKGLLSGVEDCSSVYFDNWIVEEHSSYPADNAMDLYKEKAEEFLKAKVGTEIPTSVTESSGIVLESPFTFTEAAGHVGKSNGVPYIKISAKVSNTGKEVGLIGRDGRGIPVFAGSFAPKDGELSTSIRFDLLYEREHTYAVHQLLGSFASIELMSPAELDNHLIACTGPSYNFKGVAKIKLWGNVDDIPESLPDLYNKKELTSRVEEGPEDDYTIYNLILSQNDKQAAVVYYDEKGRIYDIRITSPEMFMLSKYYDANHSLSPFITLHCASLPILVMRERGVKPYVMYDPDTYMEIPALGVGIARFTGFEVKDWQASGNKVFAKTDLVPETRFTTIILRQDY